MNNEYDNEYDNVMRDADAMLTREYQRASRAAAQAEDNYTMPNRTIAEYLELGYTISYAKSLVSRAEAEQADRLRRNVLATIDELNQYLLGNVTLEAATDAARELTHKLNASW